MQGYKDRLGMVTGTLATLLLIAGIVVVSAIASGAFRAPMREPAASGNANANVAPSNTNAVVPTQATLTGTYTCLPHRDTSGPQTLECAIGMQSTDNKYYALDLSGLTPSETRGLQTGSGVTVQGMVTPAEMLSSSHWQKYNLTGIVKVETLVESE